MCTQRVMSVICEPIGLSINNSVLPTMSRSTREIWGGWCGWGGGMHRTTSNNGINLNLLLVHLFLFSASLSSDPSDYVCT